MTDFPKLGERLKFCDRPFPTTEEVDFFNATYNVGAMIAEEIDNICYDTISKIAEENGYSEVIVFDRQKITEVLEKAIPKKPIGQEAKTLNRY